MTREEHAASGGKIANNGNLSKGRADNVVNICEMKFTCGEYEITADEAERLRNRIEAFRRETGFRGGIHLTFITPYGVRRNKYWNMVQSEVTLDDLFNG